MVVVWVEEGEMDLRAREVGCKQRAGRTRTTRARVGREESREGSSNGKVGYQRRENERTKQRQVSYGSLSLESTRISRMGEPSRMERKVGRGEDAHFSIKKAS